mmetsp:Transcript_46071/g.147360  ORF Transcript_46071/g.147360 Transcript_46071/m.147360 type:complete len:396 (-) Transcript_46071:289-1476(-)
MSSMPSSSKSRSPARRPAAPASQPEESMSYLSRRASSATSSTGRLYGSGMMGSRSSSKVRVTEEAGMLMASMRLLSSSPSCTERSSAARFSSISRSMRCERFLTSARESVSPMAARMDLSASETTPGSAPSRALATSVYACCACRSHMEWADSTLRCASASSCTKFSAAWASKAAISAARSSASAFSATAALSAAAERGACCSAWREAGPWMIGARPLRTSSGVLRSRPLKTGTGTSPSESSSLSLDSMVGMCILTPPMMLSIVSSSSSSWAIGKDALEEALADLGRSIEVGSYRMVVREAHARRQHRRAGRGGDARAGGQSVGRSGGRAFAARGIKPVHLCGRTSAVGSGREGGVAAANLKRCAHFAAPSPYVEGRLGYKRRVTSWALGTLDGL